MLQLITDAATPSEVYAQAARAMEGGCRWVQIRMKEADEEAVIAAGRLVSARAKALGATVILDDRVELVRTFPDLFDGVHLGKKDIAPVRARALLGPDAIIGATVNRFGDIEVLRPWNDVNYLGMGPFRYTTTKKNLAPVLGAEGYRTILGQARRWLGLEIPVVAIGGITVDDVPLLAGTGVAGIAVSGAINRAADPVEATRQLLDAVRAMQAVPTDENTDH